ncbi:hypothetical protein J6590_054380 [Homalodisca vitripennis]|nr:hypothetical protein J6590_054380 [Homalodisca vitripennis]
MVNLSKPNEGYVPVGGSPATSCPRFPYNAARGATIADRSEPKYCIEAGTDGNTVYLQCVSARRDEIKIARAPRHGASRAPATRCPLGCSPDAARGRATAQVMRRDAQEIENCLLCAVCLPWHGEVTNATQFPAGEAARA